MWVLFLGFWYGLSSWKRVLRRVSSHAEGCGGVAFGGLDISNLSVVFLNGGILVRRLVSRVILFAYHFAIFGAAVILIFQGGLMLGMGFDVGMGRYG